MKGKLLTIIIPTYNMEKYLVRCLDSLIVEDGELRSCVEALVVNDGSTDKSLQIARSYQDEHPEVFKVIDKKNGNYGSCINRGLKEATGKYIKILDADDFFITSSLEHFLEEIKTKDVDLVLTNYQTINEIGEVTYSSNFSLPKKQICDAGTLNDLGRNMAMHAVAYRTEILRKMNYHQTEQISYTDQEWIFAPMSQVRDFFYIDLYLYQYFVGREGQTMDAKVLSKNMHHNIIVLSRNIDVYNNISGEVITKDYLTGKLKALLEFTYTQYLYHTDVMDLTPLIEFDKNLQSLNPLLYEYMSTLHAGKLPFVRVWRWCYYHHDYGLNQFFAYRKYRLGIGLK